MAYQAKTLRLLALAQIIMGALMILFGIASLFVVPHWSSEVAFGVWFGLWVLVTGILGLIGARQNANFNGCLIGTFLGFAIVSVVGAGCMIIFYGIALRQFYDYIHFRQRHPDIMYETGKKGAALSSCMVILSVGEFCAGLTSSVFCCIANGCCDNPPVRFRDPGEDVTINIRQPQGPDQGRAEEPRHAAPTTIRTYHVITAVPPQGANMEMPPAYPM